MQTDGARLDELLEPWLSSLRQRSPHTARSYRHCVRRFLDGAGPRPTQRTAIRAYMDSLTGLSPASRAHHISAVKSFLRFAQAEDVIPTTPLDLLRRPTVAITSENRYLTEDELRRLVAAARGLSGRHYAAVLLMASTGLRVSEAAAAQWRHLYRDLKGNLGLLVVYGKGGKTRRVKVSAELFDALVELHGSETLDGRDKAPLLPDTRATPYSPNAIWRLVTSAVRTAEIEKPASPHWLRHSCATLAAQGGADAFLIKDAFGHARLETSQRYIHLAHGLEHGLSDHLPNFAA